MNTDMKKTEREAKDYKVFLCEPIHPAALDRLRSRAEIISETSRLDEIDAAINRNIKMDREWLLRCPRLKVIGIHGTGTDDVDMEAAAELGIRVTNTPGENSRSVSELIVALSLSLARRLPSLDRDIRAGVRCTVGGDVPGAELHGKVFGTVGCGNVGAGAARILRDGFGMKTIAYSPSLTDERAAELGLERCSGLEELFEGSDIISVNVPLNESTRGMINAELFSRARQGSIFINTSRGAVIDERALYEALVSGKPAAAACDVFVAEPPTLENPLTSLPNFLATPHIGANTDDALLRVGMKTVDNVLLLLDEFYKK